MNNYNRIEAYRPDATAENSPLRELIEDAKKADCTEEEIACAKAVRSFCDRIDAKLPEFPNHKMR